MGNKLIKMANIPDCLIGVWDPQRCEDDDKEELAKEWAEKQHSEMKEWVQIISYPITVLVVVLVIGCFGMCCMCACMTMTSERGILGRLMEMKYSPPKVKKRKVKFDVEKGEKDGIRESEAKNQTECVSPITENSIGWLWRFQRL